MNAEAAAKASKAWALRVAGGSWAEIAQIVGFSDDTAANRAVKNFFGTLPVVDREEQRAMWRARHELLWRQSVKDMNEQRPGSTRAAVAVARSAAILDGLDQPHRIEMSSPSDDELALLIRHLAIAAGGEPTNEADPFDEEIVDAEVVGEEAHAAEADLPG